MRMDGRRMADASGWQGDSLPRQGLCSFIPPQAAGGLCHRCLCIRRKVHVHRAFRAQRKEDIMIDYHDVLLIQALASLVGALAQLIAVLREPPG